MHMACGGAEMRHSVGHVISELTNFRSGNKLPTIGLLIYLARPNSDEYLVGEDTEIGEDTYIWGYILPDDADIRAATGWVNGTANVFYTATGVPIVALATEIAQAVLPANVVFSLVDATTQTGKLAIYTAETTAVTLAKVRSVLRDESINYLFYGRTAIAYDPQDLTTMYQNAAGTLPVYRPGSGQVDPPVGLLLDKSKGLELGPELAENGTFDTNIEGVQSIRNANNAVIPTITSWASGRLKVARDGANDFGFAIPISVEAGKSYKVLCDAIQGNALRVFLRASPTAKFSDAVAFTYVSSGVFGTKSFVLVFNASTTGTYYVIGQCVDVTADGMYHEFDNISIREIKGYHAYQATTTARPMLSGRYNLLTATEILSTQSVTTVVTDYTLSFSGTGTVTLSGTATGVLSAGTHTITCTAGDLTLTVAGSVARADLRVKRGGSSLPPYQRVDSATTYDTVGFPLYLRRDKVDDDLIVQAPAIIGQRAWGSIDTVDIAAATIAAGAYQPFGTISAGEPTCTQWIAIDGTLTAAEQAILERYVYGKSKLQVGA